MDELHEQDLGQEAVEHSVESAPKCGRNIRVRNFWGRHASKQSANIVAAEGGLSSSSISEAGAMAASALGTGIDASKDGAKAYVSSSPRAGETAENILDGYQRSNPDAPVRDVMVSDMLSPHYPKDFLGLYDKKFVEIRNQLLRDRGIDPTKYKELSPEEQEEIAEKAEEPVLAEWLGPEEKNELRRLFSLEEASGMFARIFDRHNDRIAGKLYNGSEVDLIHISHRGIMEPFLVSGALIRAKDGKRIVDLEELGGPMAILEGWESVTETDEKGDSKITVTVRGEEYIIDRAFLKETVRGHHKAVESRQKQEDETKLDTIIQQVKNPDSKEAAIDISDKEFVVLLAEMVLPQYKTESLEKGVYGELEKRLHLPDCSSLIAEIANNYDRIHKTNRSNILSLVAEINPTAYAELIGLLSLSREESKGVDHSVSFRMMDRVHGWVSPHFYPSIVPEERIKNLSNFWSQGIDATKIKMKMPFFDRDPFDYSRKGRRVDSASRKIYRNMGDDGRQMYQNGIESKGVEQGLLCIGEISPEAFEIALDNLIAQNPRIISERDKVKLTRMVEELHKWRMEYDQRRMEGKLEGPKVENLDINVPPVLK